MESASPRRLRWSHPNIGDDSASFSLPRLPIRQPRPRDGFGPPGQKRSVGQTYAWVGGLVKLSLNDRLALSSPARGANTGNRETVVRIVVRPPVDGGQHHQGGSK